MRSIQVQTLVAVENLEDHYNIVQNKIVILMKRHKRHAQKSIEIREVFKNLTIDMSAAESALIGLDSSLQQYIEIVGE